MKYRIIDTKLSSILASKYQLPDFTAKVLASYSKETIKDLLTYKKVDPLFTYMQQATDLIHKHIKLNNKIVIMGDYDCDGVLATSIMYKAFLKLNYQVGYYIPNRIKDGYGLTIEMVKSFIEKGYDLIITVDNGINAKEAINYALDNNVDVIITDHHNNDDSLKTNALYVHPKDSNLDYYVSGGFVAYHLATNLIGYDDDYLQALAAITLISDVMPLVKGNRLFIREALKNINTKQYLQIVSLANGFIDSSMIGTIIAPKINSLGRLPDIFNPNKLVKYFCSNNRKDIINYAMEIDECNNLRKQMTQDYLMNFEDVQISSNLLMVQDHELHEGLIGLLASRFTNQYHCVSFVSTLENDISKGSIRSVASINIYDILIKRSDLFLKIGGHAQAMGVSFKNEMYHEIKEYLEIELSKEGVLEKQYDVIKLEEEDLTIKNIENLRYLEPFGNAFDAPLFIINNALVVGIKSLKGGIHYKVSILFETNTYEIMFFNQTDFDIKQNDYIDIVVKLGLNEFRNKVNLNIIVEDYKII